MLIKTRNKHSHESKFIHFESRLSVYLSFKRYTLSYFHTTSTFLYLFRECVLQNFYFCFIVTIQIHFLLCIVVPKKTILSFKHYNFNTHYTCSVSFSKKIFFLLVVECIIIFYHCMIKSRPIC